MRKNKRNRQQKKSMPVLSADKLDKLHILFKKKNWPVVEGFGFSIFERYYRTLLSLDADEQDFLINLSNHFLHISQQDYLDKLLQPLKQLRDEMGQTRLIFAACLTEKDVSCTKSAQLVLYQIKGTTIKQRIDLRPYHVANDISKLESYYNKSQNNSAIVLVDDFIGTGDTALSAVNYVRRLCPDLEDNKKILLLSIVAMQEGIDALASHGIKTYSAIVRKKGISEELPAQEVPAAISMMKRIEAKQNNLNKDFHFGYKQSEALVCMERCPNNTFPIYWLAKGDAPYER